MVCERTFAPVVRLKNTTSTNDELAKWWRKEPLLPFTTITSEFQTQGRGRLGREWVAPPGTALLMSVLLNVAQEKASWVPFMAGLAVADTVGAFLPKENVKLKWPNDVLIRGLKISGILVERLGQDERTANPRTIWVSVGIGLNLRQSREDLPPVPSTSLLIEGVAGADKEKLLHQIRQRLSEYLEIEDIRSAYESRCISLGQTLNVKTPTGQVLEGLGVGLGFEGELLVEDSSGTLHRIQAGDVRINPRRPN